MLQTVTIQNFRSLRDVTVNLQKVNLLIGPNNSGKSNFLKALAFLREHYNNRIQPGLVDFERLFYKHNYTSQMISQTKSIVFGLKWSPNPEDFFNYFYELELYGFNKNMLAYSEASGFVKGPLPVNYRIKNLLNIKSEFISADFLFENNPYYTSPHLRAQQITDQKGSAPGNRLRIDLDASGFRFSDYTETQGKFLDNSVLEPIMDFSVIDTFNSIKIFRPDPSKITAENELFTHNHMNEDASNLVAFLDNMRDGYDHVWQAIQKDLNKCIPDFVGISFDKVKIKGKESLGKRFGLRDKAGKTYWAEELSEGTIYFLALLAIVHQPDPPKVLLLEEPEKGIHPRRIAEVMELIFKLAEEKDIQIILTSHSTQVVDAFQDIPESVFVFDMVDGETKIKNLQTDILEPDAEDAKSKGFPAIDYDSRSLSEHWAIGLLGGVPQ